MEFTINGWGLCLAALVAFSAGFAILNAASARHGKRLRSCTPH